jgi:hypothetical protein
LALTDGLLDGGAQFRIDAFGELGLPLPHVAQDGLQIDDDAVGELRGQKGKRLCPVFLVTISWSRPDHNFGGKFETSLWQKWKIIVSRGQFLVTISWSRPGQDFVVKQPDSVESYEINRMNESLSMNIFQQGDQMSWWKNAQNAAQPMFDKTYIPIHILLREKVAQIWATSVIPPKNCPKLTNAQRAN